MIEIHEAMRLLVVVEQTTEVLTAIYQRQPPLQELVGNGWVISPPRIRSRRAIHLFDPGRGLATLAGAGAAIAARWSAPPTGSLGQREPLAAGPADRAAGE